MAQEELFGTDKAQYLKQRVKELDADIAKAMKGKDFAKAKRLTDQQSGMLQELLNLGETSTA